MIPIGAPITATLASDGSKHNGTLAYYGESKWLCDIHKQGAAFLFDPDEIKMRYDAPAPFTLWQLNVLGSLDANDRWDWSPINLTPSHIQKYWECFKDHAHFI